METAAFMVRAVFTTCGKNISPLPKSSPTRFIPSISGPSMTFTACGYFCNASSISGCRNSVIPFCRAYFNLSSTACLRHSGAAGFGAGAPPALAAAFAASAFALISAASSMRSSAAPFLLFNTTSSMSSSCSLGILS